MEQETRSKRRAWLPFLLGAAGLATGVVIGGARAIKEMEISTEWPLNASPDAVFEALLDTRNYAEWWPEISGRTNTGAPAITAASVAQCVAQLPVSLLPFLPALHFAIRFPQIERPGRIRARLTGDVVGVAEWVIVPQREGGVLLKNNTRLRLARPLMNLAALVLPEKTWRANLEGMLIEARAGLRRALEFTEADLAVSRP